MTTIINNEHKKLNFSREREQSQACLNSAEREKNQGRKVLNVPNLRFPEFQGEWEKCKLRDLTAKVGSGSTPKGGNAVYTSAGHCFVRSQNVGMGYLILDDVAHINDGIHQKHKATELKEDDVLLNITGASIGRTAIATKEIEGGNVNQHVCIIRANSKVSPKFLCNYIQTKKIQYYIQSLQTGGSREGLNFEQIRSFPISLPNIAEQNKIAQLLDKLNDRIATQNKIIEELKKLKCAIIEELLNCRESREVCLGDVGSFVRGLTYSSDDVVEESGTIVMRSNNIVNGCPLDYKNNLVYVNKPIHSEQLLQSGDVVICMANGSSALVGKSSCYDGGCLLPITIGAFCGVYRSNEPLAKWLFQTSTYRRYIRKSLQGGNGAIANLNSDDILRMSFEIPEVSTKKRFVKLLTSTDSAIKNNTRLYDLYIAQKQYLLRQMFI